MCKNNLFKRCVRAKQTRMIKTIIYNGIFTSLGQKKFKVQLNTESLSMKWKRRLRGLIMFAFKFGVESLEQSIKLGLLVISISSAIPFSEHHFFETDYQMVVLFTVFSLLELFFSCCPVVLVAKENVLETPALVSLANFQRIQMLRLPRLAFD